LIAAFHSGRCSRRTDGQRAGDDCKNGSDPSLSGHQAFAIYFELANLAETNHRNRRRRARQLERHVRRFRDLSTDFIAHEAGASSAESAIGALRQVLVTPVFTAHPTEVRARRSC